MLDEVAASIKDFPAFAEQSNITQPWRSIIQKTLTANLQAFGYLDPPISSETSFTDSHGRIVSSVDVSINAKNHYDVCVVIDGVKHRRFVRPNTEIHKLLSSSDIFNLPLPILQILIETLFPLEDG